MAGGIKAKQKGKLGEKLLESDLNINNVFYTKTYPEFVPLGRTKVHGGFYTYGFFREHSTPDYVIMLPSGWVWVEVKVFSNLTKKTYSQSMHQYEFLRTVHALGYSAYYLVYWDIRDIWVLYPIEDLAMADSKITFVITNGIPVDNKNGYPELVAVLKEKLDGRP